MSQTMEFEKESVVAETRAVDINDIMPESLSGLSVEEYRAIEKRVVRKADFVILPIISTIYILNYIDRQNLSAAKLQGILTDLNMDTTQFATAVSILFVGYLPFQIPSNLIISNIKRPGLYIAAAATIWGTISAATAAVQSYQALLAIRVILGAVEAVFFPGVIYLMSSWYTKNQLGKRIGFLYIGQQIGNAFGGLIAAGCLQLAGVHGISGWRWLFIIEGVATVAIGSMAAWALPEFPYNARMLTQIERDVAVHRLQKEAGAAEGNEQIGTWQGFLIGLKDPKLFILTFMNLLAQCQGSIANFFPTVLASLGYNPTNTLLLTAPPYIFAAFFYVGFTWFSDKKNTIYWPIVFCMCLAVMTYIIAMTTTNIGARYFAMMLMPCSAVAPQLLLYKTINNHLPRPIAKRAAAIAMMNAVGGTSNIWMSYTFVGSPFFYPAFGAMLAAVLLFFITLTSYKVYITRQNKKLDQGGEVAKSAMIYGITQEMVDLGWRYEGY